jgi:dephospho-CoA kinase
MSLPIQIGITGGIGSGKSTVAKIFATLGVSIYDADSSAKKVMLQEDLKNAIRKEFGDQCYDAAGMLDRKYLANQVFGSPEKLKKLNSLVHPRVAEDYMQWLDQHRTEHYVLKEAALLFETGSANQLDKIIVVTAPEEIRIKRVQSRDHRSEKEIKDIIHRQWTEQQSVAKADHLIVNDDIQPLLPQALKLHELFMGIERKND